MATSNLETVRAALEVAEKGTQGRRYYRSVSKRNEVWDKKQRLSTHITYEDAAATSALHNALPAIRALCEEVERLEKQVEIAKKASESEPKFSEVDDSGENNRL